MTEDQRNPKDEHSARLARGGFRHALHDFRHGDLT